MSKSFTLVAVFVALFFGGVAGYFLRDAQVAEEKAKIFARMPAPAAGTSSLSLLVPERSKDLQVILNCSGLIACKVKQKDGIGISLRVIREGGELSVLLGDEKVSWGVFAKALKNNEFELPDFDTGRYTVQ